MAVLEVRDVVSGYGRVDILQGVSLRVEAGEIVTVIGPNGAGKSTLMKTVFGLLRPRRGQILFQGADITCRRPDRLAGEGLSYVPQEKHIFPSLTVEENLEMGYFIRKDSPRKSMEAVFRFFPFLRECRRKKAGALSGGERQMVALGRALMLEPKLLLLDEPSVGLAPRLVAEIFSRIRRINQQGVALMVIEQNAKKALEVSHRGYVLAMGRNVLADTGMNLLNNEEVARLYLGMHCSPPTLLAGTSPPGRA
jgi:ABC-type branched-subunit amino acid transport system ATPase component